MLSSVYTNSGFWISRYEIGDGTATESNTTRTSNSRTTGKAVSKPNQIPYNYVTCSESQTLASKMSPDSNKTSSLLFGIQWDLTCKFLEEYTDLTYDDIATDSTSWGNYENSTIKLTRGKYNTSPSTSNSKWTDITSNSKYTTMFLTTGASKQTNKLNIYDFSGNELEWTLEYASSDTSSPSITRGGSFNSNGLERPTKYRYNSSKSNKGYTIGFRSTLY